MALDAQVLLSILSHESSAGDISRTLRVTPVSYSAVLANGTGANQAQVAWSDSVDAAPEYSSLNLNALVDDRGTVSFSAIKVFYLRNTGSVAIITGPYAADPWAGPIGESGTAGNMTLESGSVAFFVTTSAGGWAVAGGANNLGIYVPSGVGKYEILLIGEGTIS